MDPPRRDKGLSQKLAQSLAEAGTRAFNPDVPDSSRAQAIREFDDLVQRTKTPGLVQALGILTRPGRVPPWLRARLKERLALVPLRPDGVRATLEVVFSVHPSSTVKLSEAAVPQKRGANITNEALTLASNLLSTPPAAASPETYYAAVSPQLLALLDGAEGPELVKAASYVIGFGILGRKSSGVPGTAGWKYFAEPMLNHINPPLGFSNRAGAQQDDVIDLRRGHILVHAADLETALRRLHMLVISHPNPGLCKRLLFPLVLPLWGLGSWIDPRPPMAEKVCGPSLELLKIYLRLAPSPELVPFLARNLGFVGGHNRRNPEWTYEANDEGRVQVVDATQPVTRELATQPTLEIIDGKIPKALDLITSVLSHADISTGFLELFRKWLKSARSAGRGNIKIKQEDQHDTIAQLTEMKMLQAMMERLPEKLAAQPKHILDLVGQILAELGDNDAEHEDEVTGVALSLINMVVTAPGFQKRGTDPEVLGSIQASLDRLSRGSGHFAQTANNLRLLLLYRDEIEPTPSSSTSIQTDRQVEDRKTYSLAMSYVTDPDAPPPVRTEGLNLLGTLVDSRSPALDVPGVLVLLSTLLSAPEHNEEDYLHARLVRLYTQLADRHPRSVARELADRFVDAREAHGLDARLRFGEALLQVVQSLSRAARPSGRVAATAVAEVVGPALLSVAGRRGRRPKTEARRRREERARQQKDREAAEAWGGEVPDMSEPVSEEQRRVDEALERIVGGWDQGGRGLEDVRVRASALSVLGATAEADLAGLGPRVVADAVDLCVAVLQLEREVEKGILRRAAVLFVLSFVRALDEARRKGAEPGFGFGARAQEDVLRTLRYVAETDNDGLVVQHARDVVESLENWQVVRLLPAEGSSGRPQQALEGLTKLAGLEVDPDRSVTPPVGSRPRPKIEEVE